MTTAAYYRDWRAAHPEYRARQTRLRAERRLRQGRESRATEYANNRTGPVAPLPVAFLGHPLFDAARAIVGPSTSTLTALHDPLYEDSLSVAVVALIEGADPVSAVKRFRALENGWRRVTCELVAA